MAIRVVLWKGLYCPQVFCDYCGARIVNGAQGLYEYEVDDKGKPVDGRLYFVHVGHCCRAFRAEHGADGHGDRLWFDDMLGMLPTYLTNNLKGE